MPIPTIKLNTGAEMPAAGFGTWELAEGSEAERAVSVALKAGYRLIDTARIYGNETSVGRAIAASGIPRRDIFVTTKLWTSDFGYDSALKAFDASLKRLGLDYIDLYLLHWPNGPSRRQAWRALAELHEQGRAKAVGVSNYMTEELKEVLGSGLLPAVNQIKFHPHVYRRQKPVLDLCRQNGIIVEAYSPLARGQALDNKSLKAIAARHGKTPAQALLRWAIQHGTVPIPKSASPDRIKSNLDVFDFELDDADMSELNALSR